MRNKNPRGLKIYKKIELILIIIKLSLAIIITLPRIFNFLITESL